MLWKELEQAAVAIMKRACRHYKSGVPVSKVRRDVVVAITELADGHGRDHRTAEWYPLQGVTLSEIRYALCRIFFPLPAELLEGIMLIKEGRKTAATNRLYRNQTERAKQFDAISFGTSRRQASRRVRKLPPMEEI